MVRTKKRTKVVLDDDDLDNVKMHDFSANNSNSVLQQSGNSTVQSANKMMVGGIENNVDAKSLLIRSEVNSTTHRETVIGGMDDNQSVQSLSRSPLKPASSHNNKSVGQKSTQGFRGVSNNN